MRIAAAAGALAMFAVLVVVGVSQSPTLLPVAETPTVPTSPEANTCHYQGSPGAELPDPACTPGALDPVVTQDNIHQTICVSGYTATVRPPVNYTNALKRKQMTAYGRATDDPRSFEMDHRTPLETGGSPQSILNLWPERYERDGATAGYGAESKDRLENYVHQQICKGAMTLAEGQAVFMEDFFKWRDDHLGKGF